MSGTKDLQKAKAVIYSADMQPVIDRLVAIEKWRKADANAVVAQYRNYLFLRKKFPDEELPPSEEIDEAWHAHVLHTADYRDFCQRAFDDLEHQFLDHHPHIVHAGSSSELAEKFERTQSHYFEEFGDYIYEVTYRPWWLRPWVAIIDFFRTKFGGGSSVVAH